MKKLIFAFACLFLAVPSQARIITVDDDGPADFNNIQAAINDSNDGDTIIVSDGIYTGNGNRDIDYLSKAITLRSANGPLSCIVDCEGTYLDNHRGFYFHSGEDENSILDGFTITNGYIVVMCEGGAGIHIDNSSPTIRNCIIRGNVTKLDPVSLCFCYGGGIYFNGTTLTMTNCIINDNSVGEFGLGGGICCMSGSNTIIRNCIISNNAATTPYDTVGQGGGIYLDYYANSLYMVNCTIAENTASSDGGGIYFEQYENPPSITIRNSILWDNSPNQISTYGTYKGLVLCCDVQGGWPGPGPGGKPPNMDENPRFVDPDGDDNIFGTDDDNLRLLLGSPCIDAGDNSVVTVTTDLDGNPRIIGGRVDMGAYEFQGPFKRYYHVDGINGDNTNDGLSRETAFETIQYAIDEANDCDTVLVWPGVYNEAATNGINFMGKAITVKSTSDAAVLEVPGFVAVSFTQGEDGNSVFSNFVVRGSSTGILALFANPTINNVTVVDNDNGFIADNADPNITNSIFWNNTNGDLFGSPVPLEARYSCIEEGGEGEGNISIEPGFVDANGGDYHLLSESGRYRATTDEWLLDDVTSPCVDGGDPSVNPSNERMPNGGRINMGAYGNTAYASMSEWPIKGDINNDGRFNFMDIAILLDGWLEELPWAQ